MLPDGRRLGAHMPLGTGMLKAADRAHEIGAETIQIFADNPTAWRRRSGPPVEQAAFRTRLDIHGITPLAIHAAYLVNLAGPDEDFWMRSIAMLAHELRTGPGFGARFVNVHIGSHRGAGVPWGIARIAEGVARVMAAIERTPETPMLVLENSAGGGFGLGATVEELEAIAEAIEARGVGRQLVGFCLDTAHAWGAGHDLRDPGATDRFLEDFDTRIGIDRLAMVHLNDSKSELGSHTDRHEHVGAGQIGEAGMAYLLTHPLLARAAYFVETPGMDEGYDAINLERARRLAAGLSLDPLPPGAMEVRGSRSRSAPPAGPDDE